jgi:hypothetical protein
LIDALGNIARGGRHVRDDLRQLATFADDTSRLLVGASMPGRDRFRVSRSRTWSRQRRRRRRAALLTISTHEIAALAPALRARSSRAGRRR